MLGSETHIKIEMENRMLYWTVGIQINEREGSGDDNKLRKKRI